MPRRFARGQLTVAASATGYQSVTRSVSLTQDLRWSDLLLPATLPPTPPPSVGSSSCSRTCRAAPTCGVPTAQCRQRTVVVFTEPARARARRMAECRAGCVRGRCASRGSPHSRADSSAQRALAGPGGQPRRAEPLCGSASRGWRHRRSHRGGAGSLDRRRHARDKGSAQASAGLRH